MKLIIAATGPHPTDQVDPRFGRAAFFIQYDSAAETFMPLNNAAQVAAPQGAGVQAAQLVVAAGAQALLTGRCGPKAFRILTESGVHIYSGCTGTVSEAVQAWLDGQLAPLAEPDGSSHH